MSPDPDRLPADRFIRMKRLEGFLRGIDPGAGGRALDVGGYPGLLADCLPEREIWTLDRPECERQRYRRGSALDIPFDDGEFDVAVASDMLEHIAPKDRPRALEEMRRVARRAVVISGPFDTPGAALSDERAAAWHERLTGEPHRWLAEHTANGLPSLDEVEGFFQATQAPTRRFAFSELTASTLTRFADIVLSALPGGPATAETLSRARNQAPEPPHRVGALFYRHAVVACLDSALTDATLGDDEIASAAATENDATALKAFEELTRGLDQAVEALARTLEQLKNPSVPPAAASHIAALEQALEDNRVAAASPPRRPGSWLKRLFR